MEFIRVLRRSGVPAIYTNLNFVRYRQHVQASVCDIQSEADQDIIQKLKAIVSNKICVSELESVCKFFLVLEVSKNILTCNGNSKQVVKYNCAYWKLWDVETLFGSQLPCEQVALEKVGLSLKFVSDLAKPISCLPLLLDCEKVIGDKFGAEMLNKIKNFEEPEIAALNIERKKCSLKKNLPKKNKSEKIIPSSLRERILRRDSFRCIYCGLDSSKAKLEVNHILSRSLIKKLTLSPKLLTDEANLCASCFECNRGKSDHLYKEDIIFYEERFDKVGHPNRSILEPMRYIAQLQNYK